MSSEPKRMSQNKQVSPPVNTTSKTGYYIYSTLTSAQRYTVWAPAKDSRGKVMQGPNQERKAIYVAGGANVVDAKHMVTPKGVSTHVSGEDMELLKKDETFNRHLDAGYLTCESVKADVDEVVKNLNKRDESSPLTPDDYADGRKPKPKLNSKAS